MLLMLEDNAERVQRFGEAPRAIDPEMPLLIWRDAKDMIREVRLHLPAARVIWLDHDDANGDAARFAGNYLGPSLVDHARVAPAYDRIAALLHQPVSSSTTAGNGSVFATPKQASDF